MALLDTLGLSEEQLGKRKFSIGGSDANVIMSGDEQKIHKLWMKKTGQIEFDDLSHILAVQMGSYTEALNREWFTKQLGLDVRSVGEERIHKEHNFLTCTLDGIVCDESSNLCVWEAKHVSPFHYSIEKIVDRYQPQLQHNMAVTGLKKAYLSVFSGNANWEYAVVNEDPFYQSTLLKRECEFWGWVESLKAPENIKPAPKPIGAKQLKEIDMTGDNEWAHAALDYIENKESAGLYKKANETLRGLVKRDVGLATGHGVQVKRSKANKLYISELDK